MLRIFKSKIFAKFARKEKVSDATLRAVAKDIEDGKTDVDYGGHVIKQRMARPHEGKSGGYRAIILYRRADKMFFVFGFAKHEQDNIDRSDEQDFKLLAKFLLAATEQQLKKLLDDGKYTEVGNP